MDLKNKLEHKIKTKKAEIASLEKQIKEARVYLKATQEALNLLDKGQKKSSVTELTPKAGTAICKIFQVLKKARRPMKAMDLLVALRKKPTPKNRQALIGSLGVYARQEKFFVRTGPNTFGLLEWQRKKKIKDTRNKNELPEDFGLR